jgi:hypothetical protein
VEIDDDTVDTDYEDPDPPVLARYHLDVRCARSVRGDEGSTP